MSAACCMRQNPRGSKPLGSEDRSHSRVRQSFPRACAMGVRLASHTPVVLRAMHLSPKPQAPALMSTRLREQNLRSVYGADDGCEQRTRWLA